jgi:hypothetical protein
MFTHHLPKKVCHGLAGVTLAVAIVGASASSALANPPTPSTGSTTANVAVQEGIALTGLTPSFTLTGPPGTTVTGSSAVSYNVETNDPAGYTVTVQAAGSALLPETTGNTDTIPIGDLLVNDHGAGSPLALSAATPVTVHTQTTRSVNGGDNLSSDYQITIPVVKADTYTATLNYVASGL